MNIKKFIYPDFDGNSWGVVSAEQQWANVYALRYNKPERRLDQGVWQNLFVQAKEAALAFGAESIEVRIRLEYEPALFKTVLRELGFKKKAGRIEYQCEIQNLPAEEGTPLIWKTAKDLNWDLKQIAHFTQEITRDALDIDPNEKPESFIQDWLYHNEFTSGSDCVFIGFLNDKPCTLTVVQIEQESGWSRISYMGIIPSHRGKGLGKWVHRHGFAVMKEQGGKLYHGGTHIENWPMRKLFEAHGCHVFCEMEEWGFNVKEMRII